MGNKKHSLLFLVSCFLFGMWIGYMGFMIGALVFDQLDIIAHPTPPPKSIIHQKSSALDIKGAAYKEALRQQLDPALVFAVIETESNWKINAVGKAGELGLMQLHPKWHIGASTNPLLNLELGIAYLKKAILTCGGIENGLRCYNGGINKRSLINVRAKKYARRVLERKKTGSKTIDFAWDTRSAASHSK